MIANDSGFSLDIRDFLRYGALVMMLAIAFSLVESAHAQGRPINVGVSVSPEVTTVLYFDSAANLLWVEKFAPVKSRNIIPIEDKALMAKIPFTALTRPQKHFDCTTCPEKKADLVTSGVATKAVYCGRSPGGYAAPIIVEDLSTLSPRLIELAATTDPFPCPFPKKCHCGGANCCCW